MNKFIGIAVLILVPSLGWACACGCGVFDVRTRSMFPTSDGGVAFFEYNYMDQNRSWSGTSRTSGEDSADKEIRTDYYTAGAQYMFSREWGVIVFVPYESRYFKTTTDTGETAAFSHSAMGDVRIKGIYSGFSEDMSSGITFGLKLPTGDHSFADFDPDTQIGTGSTDVLLGTYLMGRLPVVDRWDWFVTGQLDQPALTQDGYRPGSEIDAVAGIYYNGLSVKNLKVAPVAQIIGSHHWRDTGSAAASGDTGYDRILVSPGIEFDMGRVSLYGDVAFPVYERVNGNQLVAPELFTVRLSCGF